MSIPGNPVPGAAAIVVSGIPGKLAVPSAGGNPPLSIPGNVELVAGGNPPLLSIPGKPVPEELIVVSPAVNGGKEELVSPLIELFSERGGRVADELSEGAIPGKAEELFNGGKVFEFESGNAGKLLSPVFKGGNSPPEESGEGVFTAPVLSIGSSGSDGPPLDAVDSVDVFDPVVVVLSPGSGGKTDCSDDELFG